MPLAITVALPPFKMYLRHGTKAAPHIYNITHEVEKGKGNKEENLGIWKLEGNKICKILFPFIAAPACSGRGSGGCVRPFRAASRRGFKQSNSYLIQNAGATPEI
ncbi:MAG: hypothetical protein Pg6A_16620 [Termitinemataceae bacterium]|nr:MAG: hypothetical protein Pg6A_16620 [Termitinemataceae bacterium]